MEIGKNESRKKRNYYSAINFRLIEKGDKKRKMKKTKILIENKIICPNCSGFGYIPDYTDDEQTCRECHGTGVITKHRVVKKEKVNDGLDSIDRFVLAHQKKVIK